EKERSASAASTFLPRIICANRLSLRGDTLRFRTTACASLSERTRSRFALPITIHLGLDLGPHGPLVAAMAVKDARRRELAELVTNHVFRHRDRHVLDAVVHAERQADELRQYRRAPAPDLDHLIAARGARLLRLLQQVAVDEWTFPDRA